MIIKPEELTSNDLFTKLGKCDFIICYNNDHDYCHCHFHVVAASSITIKRLDNKGKFPPQINLHTKNELTCLDDAIKFFYGSNLTINENNVNELIQIGHILKSQVLLREVVPPYIFFQKKEKVEKELLSAENLNMVNPSSMRFAALFFQWLITDASFISQIHESILCQLISHPDFKIESEDFLLEKLIEAKAPISAFKRIRYEFITPKGYKMIFDFFNPMPDPIFDILKEKFSFSNKCDTTNNPRFVPFDSFKDMMYEYVSP